MGFLPVTSHTRAILNNPIDNGKVRTNQRTGQTSPSKLFKALVAVTKTQNQRS
jgi:hypothetical protein